MNLFSENIKKNLKNSFLFFLPSIFAMCIQLFSTPIFSKYMTSYDFAVMGYFTAIQNFFLPILNLSLFPYYMRGYHKRTEDENKSVINNTIIFLSFANLITISFGVIALSIYFKIANVSFPLFPYIFFSLFASYFSIYIASLTMNYKMQKKGVKFALVRSIYPALSIGLGLLFVVGFNWGAKGRMGAILIGQGLIGIYAFFTLFKKHIKFDWKIIRDALKLGYPLIFMAFLQFPMQSLDRIFLERLDNIDAFALYNIGLRFSGIMMMLTFSVFQAFEPDFYKFIGKKEWKKLVISVIAVYSSLSLFNVVFNIVSKPIIGYLTSYRYTESYHYADIAVWSNILLSFTYLLSIFFVIYNRTKLLLANRIILAVLAIVVLKVCINHWEFYGAIWAKLILNLLYIIIMIATLLFIYIKKNGFSKLIKISRKNLGYTRTNDTGQI